MICPSAAQDNGMARQTVNVDQRFSGGSCETTGQHALVPGAYERGTAFHNQHQSIRDIAGHTMKDGRQVCIWSSLLNRPYIYLSGPRCGVLSFAVRIFFWSHIRCDCFHDI